ncbi:180L [Invertebrate iridescent virus Kaz2018]|uniref:Uncharacterized protein n=1 Tax=Iridovirus sp. TaxID=135728 RepID=A0AAU7YEE7_9VIRU|nr:180L [Invertebrate iridescent virus Kaz2018]
MMHLNYTHSKIQFQDLQSERINLSKYYHLKILFYLGLSHFYKIFFFQTDLHHPQ